MSPELLLIRGFIGRSAPFLFRRVSRGAGISCRPSQKVYDGLRGATDARDMQKRANSLARGIAGFLLVVLIYALLAAGPHDGAGVAGGVDGGAKALAVQVAPEALVERMRSPGDR